MAITRALKSVTLFGYTVFLYNAATFLDSGGFVGDLSEHFNRREFACHCGCGCDDISDELVNLLEGIRTSLNEPIHILSGVRCEKHNKACGGVPNSQHKLGLAADIQISGITPTKLATFLENNFKIGGMGIYEEKGFVHVDVRKIRARWHG